MRDDDIVAWDFYAAYALSLLIPELFKAGHQVDGSEMLTLLRTSAAMADEMVAARKLRGIGGSE